MLVKAFITQLTVPHVITAQTKAIKIAQFLASSAEYRSTKTQRKKKNIATPNNADANKGDPNNDSFIIRPKFQCLPTERNLTCHTSLLQRYQWLRQKLAHSLVNQNIQITELVQVGQSTIVLGSCQHLLDQYKIKSQLTVVLSQFSQSLQNNQSICYLSIKSQLISHQSFAFTLIWKQPSFNSVTLQFFLLYC